MLSQAPIFGQTGLSRQLGILISGIQMRPGEKPKHLPWAVSGVLTISDNEFDLTSEIPEKTMSRAIFVFGATGASLRILGNRII